MAGHMERGLENKVALVGGANNTIHVGGGSAM